MSAFLAYLARIGGIWPDGLFVAGVVLGITAQVVAYRSGERTPARLTGMCCGIASIVLIFIAGQIAAARLWD